MEHTSHCSPLPSSPVPQPTIHSAEDLFLLLARRASGRKEKALWRVDLDRSNGVVGYQEIVSKGADSIVVDPRPLFAGALLHGAAAIALVHNHPSGSLDLDDGDYILTDVMAIWGELVGVRLIDHVVITDRAWLSFRGKGLL